MRYSFKISKACAGSLMVLSDVSVFVSFVNMPLLGTYCEDRRTVIRLFLKYAYQYKCKALCLLKELSNTGTIKWMQLPKVVETPISNFYQEALNGFSAEKSECYAAYTLKKSVIRARQISSLWC
jgi:hypothetical protein